MNATNYLEVQLRKHIFLTGSYTKPSHLYICLCTADPTEAATGSSITEPSGNGYARQQLDPSDSNWNAASSTDGKASNASAIIFTASGGSWGTISHIAICDASSAGNCLFYGPLTASKAIGDGDSLTYQIDALSISVA